MGVVVFISYKFIHSYLNSGFIYDTISLFTSVLMGAITYGILIVIFNVEEIRFVIDFVKNKFDKSLSHIA